MYNALEFLHNKLTNTINIINQDILSQITPWQNHILIDMELEDTIRRYINIAGIISFVLVLLLGIIPLIFLIVVIISRSCCHHRKGSIKNHLFVVFVLLMLIIYNSSLIPYVLNSNRIPMNHMTRTSDVPSTGSHPNKKTYDEFQHIARTPLQVSLIQCCALIVNFFFSGTITIQMENMVQIQYYYV
mgnify:CR=1 FL=1